MNQYQNSKLTTISQNLRKSMTKEERKLWYEFLKQLPVTVHRQKPIENYIVDFYIPSSKLVIELDGSQHYEEEYQKKDEIRDQRLKELGLTVLRFSNAEVNQNLRGVCEDILNHKNQLP